MDFWFYLLGLTFLNGLAGILTLSLISHWLGVKMPRGTFWTALAILWLWPLFAIIMLLCIAYVGWCEWRNGRDC